MHVVVALLILLCACNPAPDPQPPVVQPSEAETMLRRIAQQRPRTGQLVVTPDVLQLRIRRGRRTMPFLNVPRSVYQLGCYVAAETHHNLISSDAWWLFTSADQAVAVQLTTYGAHVFYWDSERDCPIRTAALDAITLTDEVPLQYYKADDAQVAYQWNQNETPFNSFTGVTSGSSRITGDRAADFIADMPGEELLIVDPGLISIRSTAGDVLLQETFEIDPDWPCYDAQLNVFDSPDGELYAIATFDTFGTIGDCEATDGDSRFTMSISDWDPARRRFVRSFQLVDLLRPLDEAGEDSVIETTRHNNVAGGVLRVTRRVAKRYEQGTEQDCTQRDATTGQCTANRECWRWSSSNEREAHYTLIGADGVEVDVGSARAGLRERGEECD